MRIGLTYDLRSWYLAHGYSEEQTAEFDRDDTIDALEQALQTLGHQTERIGNAQQLMQALDRGERWELVFNLCEGLNGAARESQVPCILDVYGVPYTFADAGVLALCLNKSWTKAVVREAGIATPDSVLLESKAAVLALARSMPLALPLFAKPNGEGTSKGVDANSIIRVPEQLIPVCTSLLEQFGQPVLVETYLPGREFTVGLIGSETAAQVLGTLEIRLLEGAEPGVYSYSNKEQCETRVEYRLQRAADDPLVAASEALALQAWQLLGCRDGGRVDVRVNAQGQPMFLEVNPLAGLHPEHSDLPMLASALGVPYVDLIRQIVESAQARTLVKPLTQATPSCA